MWAAIVKSICKIHFQIHLQNSSWTNYNHFSLFGADAIWTWTIKHHIYFEHHTHFVIKSHFFVLFTTPQQINELHLSTGKIATSNFETVAQFKLCSLKLQIWNLNCSIVFSMRFWWFLAPPKNPNNGFWHVNIQFGCANSILSSMR